MTNRKFIEKANMLAPDLIEEIVKPIDYNSEENIMSTGEVLILDFGNHYTGYYSCNIDYIGHHPDAPVWMRISFAERLCEFDEKAEEYKGWISKGWIQQEQIHVDVIPSRIILDRRYAFRYVKIEILDCSQRFKVKIVEPQVKAVSSANDARLEKYSFRLNSEKKHFDEHLEDDKLKFEKLDKIACRTLHECMQSVFEDGPKRDRRLWIGDLRLQALVNYETYKQNDLVKRCLYLFAGNTLDNGQIAANIFISPEVEADDQAMLDYSLFFIPILLEYVRQTGDKDTLNDLYDVAINQIKIMETYFDGDVIRDSDKMGWTFVDWNLELNRQASAQGICLYALGAAIELADLYGDKDNEDIFKYSLERKKEASKKAFFDNELGVFISGEKRQISFASQCWMIIGGAINSVEGANIIRRIEELSNKDGVVVQRMVTPYMYHHYIEALIECDLYQEALNVMNDYWGGMVNQGADTFWELYDPKNPSESPYGGTIVNSYCHAWSCAPSYFLRKYFK